MQIAQGVFGYHRHEVVEGGLRAESIMDEWVFFAGVVGFRQQVELCEAEIVEGLRVLFGMVFECQLPFEAEGVVQGEAQDGADALVVGQGQSEGAAVIQLDGVPLEGFPVVVNAAGNVLENKGDEIHGRRFPKARSES